jgi:hypothetical protein
MGKMPVFRSQSSCRTRGERRFQDASWPFENGRFWADSVAKVPRGAAADFPLKDETSDSHRAPKKLQLSTSWTGRLPVFAPGR